MVPLWVQRPVAAHRSSVHSLPSSQSRSGPVWQRASTQLSFTVHGFPSLHEPERCSCVHPPSGRQPSRVHSFPSSQARLPSPEHAPSEHWSLIVQLLLSLHDSLLWELMHPKVVSHRSCVQALPSSHEVMDVALQPPERQWSPVVHAFPSVQGSVLLV
jgi:hypothetical protein